MKKFKKIIIASYAIALIAFSSCEDSDRYDELSNGQFNPVVPVASFDYVINGQEVTFTNNSTNATNYEWNFDDDQAVESTAIDTLFTFDEGVNPAIVSLSAINTDSGLTNIFETEISFLNPSFNVSVDLMTVSFENTSISGVSYIWDFGDNVGISTEENPSYEYPDFGTYIVSLTVTDSFGNEETIINNEVVVAQPGAGTFRAEVLSGDFDKDSENIQNPWAVNPDNSSDFDFWDNIPLETIVEAFDGGQNKGSSSSTSNFTPGSLKFNKESHRAYQVINIEGDVDYTITGYAKNKSASVGDLVGTFYVLPYEPENEDIIVTDNLIAHPVFASATGAWDEATFEFTTTSTFSFDEDSVALDDVDILTSVDQEWIVLYFVPNLTTAEEVNLDDVSIVTKGFE